MCYGSHVKQFHLHTGGRTDILLGSWDRQTHELWYKKNKEKLDQQREKGWVLAVMYSLYHSLYVRICSVG